MAVRRNRFALLLLFLVPLLAINVSASPIRPVPSTALVANLTGAGVLPHGIEYFPPGPPRPHYPYLIPDTDLGIEFSPLGQIPHRNEALVKKVIMEGIHDSLEYRVTAKMPGRGYIMQEGGFLLSVTHSAGASELTWGMWTIALVGINEYVQAYPGYDFHFTIRKFPDEDIEGYVIGTGFAMTR